MGSDLYMNPPPSRGIRDYSDKDLKDELMRREQIRNTTYSQAKRAIIDNTENLRTLRGVFGPFIDRLSDDPTAEANNFVAVLANLDQAILDVFALVKDN